MGREITPLERRVYDIEFEYESPEEFQDRNISCDDANKFCNYIKSNTKTSVYRHGVKHCDNPKYKRFKTEVFYSRLHERPDNNILHIAINYKDNFDKDYFLQFVPTLDDESNAWIEYARMRMPTEALKPLFEILEDMIGFMGVWNRQVDGVPDEAFIYQCCRYKHLLQTMTNKFKIYVRCQDISKLALCVEDKEIV